MSTSDPTLSIGMPVYNEKHLKEALNSLQAQEFRISS